MVVVRSEQLFAISSRGKMLMMQRNIHQHPHNQQAFAASVITRIRAFLLLVLPIRRSISAIKTPREQRLLHDVRQPKHDGRRLISTKDNPSPLLLNDQFSSKYASDRRRECVRGGSGNSGAKAAKRAAVINWRKQRRRARATAAAEAAV
jgi:hypothetical protein